VEERREREDWEGWGGGRRKRGERRDQEVGVKKQTKLDFVGVMK
jgi:hypothetical protein